MTPGFHRLPNDDYHKGDGISSSNLKDILRSPAHMVEKKENPPDPTPAMQFGSGWHTMALEGMEKFEEIYCVLPPDFNGRTNAGKELKADIENRGMISVKHDDYKKMEAMTAVIHNHDSASSLLTGGEPELSGYWIDPSDPRILCKLRLDWIRKDHNTIVDLKSCTDARPGPFTKHAYDMGYHIQAGWYCYGATQITGIEHSDFRFICVEKEPPYGLQVYQASQELLQEGLAKCQEALDIYAQCLDTDTWPCYGDTEEELNLPAWVRKRNQFYE